MNDERIRTGTAYGLCAYLMWGLFPLYWKRLAAVDALQIMCNRIVWSCAFTFTALLVGRKLGTLFVILRSPKRFAYAALSGVLISANWFIYIWAVNSGNIVESSMGYYLNPLISAAFGLIFFRERADRFQAIAFCVATVGVAAMIVSYGRVPWISLSLASTFALYGLIKKKADLDALGGLFVETAFVAPAALAWLAWSQAAGTGAYGRVGALETILLVLAGVVTAVPLFCYSAAAVRIPLTTLGFLQYVSPTLQLLIGLFVYGEILDGPRLAAFGFVVIALAIFSVGRLVASRKSGSA
ncbi:MAG: EamA family transporter RarD [Spirochaetes bacterium]|nr:EamA family transporter RarD [Spirochaetota bacterium]